MHEMQQKVEIPLTTRPRRTTFYIKKEKYVMRKVQLASNSIDPK